MREVLALAVVAKEAKISSMVDSCEMRKRIKGFIRPQLKISLVSH